MKNQHNIPIRKEISKSRDVKFLLFVYLNYGIDLK